MERVDQVLRDLLQAALSEHGSEAPAFTDVAIEITRGCFELRLWLEFSNGYRTFTSVSAGTCYAFCERHAAWDVETFRHAILRQARRIYARMLREQGRRAWYRELAQRLANGIERSMRSRRATWAFAFYRRGVGLCCDEGTPQARARSLQLLGENLTPAQREQYKSGYYFDVTGGTSGNRYRIHYGRSMNIDQLDQKGRRVCGWCFFPTGRLATGDIILAQKVALELYELEALQVAHKIAAAQPGMQAGNVR